MSNYSPIVLYGPKDALTTGDPNKLIKGVQLDAELSAIAAAVSSKLDSPPTNVQVTGTANTTALGVTGSATTSQSFGITIAAGTNASDYALSVNNASSAGMFKVRGDGKVFSGTADITGTIGSFTATYGGVVSGSVTINYIRVGSLVTLYCPSASTPTSSGSGSFNISGIPSTIRPTVTIQGAGAVGFNGGTVSALYTLTSAGLMTWTNANGGSFAGPNNLGFVLQTLCTYVIQ